VQLDVHLVPPGGGDVVGDSAARRVEILSDRDELHSTWSRFGPGRDGASPHVHREHSDLFYVLEGELAVLVGDGWHTLPAGTLVHAPPLLVHGFRNGSDEREVRYLNFHGPGGGFAPYLRREAPGFDSYDPPADGGRPAADGEIARAETGGERGSAVLVDTEAICIVEAWGVPGDPSPPPHLHERHVESFYVLAGEMTFTLDGEETVAAAGTWAQVPPGTAHTFAFTGSEPVRFLTVHTPSCGFGTFVRALEAAGTDEERAAARAAFDQRPA
jgi:quercetin dioxygenase-like cupin family protein